MKDQGGSSSLSFYAPMYFSFSTGYCICWRKSRRYFEPKYQKYTYTYSSLATMSNWKKKTDAVNYKTSMNSWKKNLTSVRIQYKCFRIGRSQKACQHKSKVSVIAKSDITFPNHNNIDYLIINYNFWLKKSI